MRTKISAAAGGLAVLLLSAPAFAQSQNYVPFRLDAGISAADTFSQQSYGIAGFAEPKFMLLDQVDVGLRVEGAVMMGGNIATDSGAGGSSQVSVKQNVVSAMLAKGDFYMTTTRVRPFVGLGFGFYTLAGQSTTSGSSGATIEQKAGRYFGVAPQLGLEMGAFRLSATYNKILGTDVEVQQTVGGPVTKYSDDYVTLDFGVRFGGGRRIMVSPAPGPTR